MADDAANQSLAAPTASRFVRPPVMGRLAQATRAAHEHIENNPALRRLLQADCSVNHYRHLLATLHGFYHPLETRLLADPGIAGHPELGGRLGKHRLLAADLRTLGLSTRQLAALPRCRALPSWQHWHEALGVLYVLEGATLGGQLIRQHLLEHLHPRWHGALGFYSCYGKQVGKRWRSFQQLVGNSLGNDPPPPSLWPTIAAARHTFEALDGWLTRTVGGRHPGTTG